MGSNSAPVSPRPGRNPFDDICDPQFGIEPNVVGEPIDLQEVVPRVSLRGATLRAKQALSSGRVRRPELPPSDPRRGTPDELRRRRGHSVPPPPRTWAPPEGHRDADVDDLVHEPAPATSLLPQPEAPGSPDGADPQWTAERLGELHAMVTKHTQGAI